MNVTTVHFRVTRQPQCQRINNWIHAMQQPFACLLKGSRYEGGGEGHMPAFIPWRRIGTTCPSRRSLYPCYIRHMAYLAAMRHPFAPAYN